MNLPVGYQADQRGSYTTAYMTMLATLLSLALAIVPAPKTVAQVELLDSATVMVVYTDQSLAIGPLASFDRMGSPLPGAPLTIIEPPGPNNELVMEYQDAVNPAIKRVVRTGCATLTPIDCVIAHKKLCDAMLAAFPAAKPVDK